MVPLSAVFHVRVKNMNSKLSFFKVNLHIPLVLVVFIRVCIFCRAFLGFALEFSFADQSYMFFYPSGSSFRFALFHCCPLSFPEKITVIVHYKPYCKSIQNAFSKFQILH